MGKWVKTMIYSCHKILLRKQEMNNTKQSDESCRYYVEQNEPDTRVHFI